MIDGGQIFDDGTLLRQVASLDAYLAGTAYCVGSKDDGAERMCTRNYEGAHVSIGGRVNNKVKLIPPEDLMCRKDTIHIPVPCVTT